jgi:hypothetical protein
MFKLHGDRLAWLMMCGMKNDCLRSYEWGIFIQYVYYIKENWDHDTLNNRST